MFRIAAQIRCGFVSSGFISITVRTCSSGNKLDKWKYSFSLSNLAEDGMGLRQGSIALGLGNVSLPVTLGALIDGDCDQLLP